MKTFLVLMSLVYAYSASASAGGVTPLTKRDLSLSQAQAKLVSVKEICPRVPGRMSCQALGSTVLIKVSLGGCLDRLGGYFSHFEAVNGKGYLFFGALTVANEASRSARCVQAPFEMVTVGVPFEGPIELVNIEYTGALPLVH